ncbi:hypothetical protein V8C86DRAFT_2475701 [Haematococcus lacustris]
MLIPITGPPGGVAEWALIELQGRLKHVQGEDELISEIGMLLSPVAKPDCIQLTIGYHQIEGKRVSLKKPFAILQRVGSVGESAADVKYEVVGVIRSKFLFKTRPTALISKPRA